jgi:hypothetical protein
MKAKYKNLLNPTAAQVKHRARLWVDALRNNKKKATGIMYKEGGGRCCLAVAQDVAKECGVKVGFEGDSFPTENVKKFFGWTSTTPELVVFNKKNGEISVESSIDLNDGVESSNNKFQQKGLSHKQIAECVENTFIHPSKKKFSFKI